MKPVRIFRHVACEGPGYLGSFLKQNNIPITDSGELVTTVLDIVSNEVDIAVVDSSTEAHMLDLLIYRTPAKIERIGRGGFTYMVAGRSCLAGSRCTNRSKNHVCNHGRWWYLENDRCRGKLDQSNRRNAEYSYDNYCSLHEQSKYSVCRYWRRIL